MITGPLLVSIFTLKTSGAPTLLGTADALGGSGSTGVGVGVGAGSASFFGSGVEEQAASMSRPSKG